MKTAWADLRSKFVGAGAVALFNNAIGNTIIPWTDLSPETNRLFSNADDKLLKEELFSGPTVHKMQLVFYERFYEPFTSLSFKLVNDQDNFRNLAVGTSPTFCLFCQTSE